MDAQDAIASHDPSSEEGNDNRRRLSRRPVHWPATCIHGPDRWHVTIIDASEAGFGLSQELPLAADTRLVITIEQIGSFTCRVAWKGGGRSGVELLENGRISERELDELVRALDVIDPVG